MTTQSLTVRSVLGALPRATLEKLAAHGKVSGFNHGWYWHGPEREMGIGIDDKRFIASESCPLAFAFEVPAASKPGSWWGAEVGQNLMAAINHLSTHAGGEAGMVQYITELSNLSHDELMEVIEDSLREGPLSYVPTAHIVRVKLVEQSIPRIAPPSEAPLVFKVLGALTSDQLGRLEKYSIDRPFHHGWYWHGPEGDLGILGIDERFSRPDCGCPLAVAFQVEPNRGTGGWWGARADDNLIRAVRHLSYHAGGERGMETYIEQLSSLDSAGLNCIIGNCRKEH